MNNQDTNQTVKQTETVAPVANDQSTTQATAQATDTKPADNTQDATVSTPLAPAAPTVPDTVKLELSADQAEMVQDLLSEYDYAYRSDREVDCKRELVRRDKIGKYPYVAEPPAPEIINPAYDWVNKEWYSKSGSTSLPEIAQAVKELSDGQANQNELLASMQNLMLTIAGSQKTTASTQATTATETEKTANN